MYKNMGSCVVVSLAEAVFMYTVVLCRWVIPFVLWAHWMFGCARYIGGAANLDSFIFSITVQ